MYVMKVPTYSQMIPFYEIVYGFQFDGLLYSYPTHNDSLAYVYSSKDCPYYTPSKYPNRNYESRCRGWYRNTVDKTENEFYFGKPTDWVANGTYIYTCPLCFKTYNISDSSSLYSVACTGYTLQKLQTYFKNLILKSASIRH
ncbi:hypothetical protein PPERSA_00620 [Pseudocohnilembus persalinus]|uniref:Uncharacterized protein n=1 Tax=Pseudocohnilembus persalinus TaxID=266149 RepID=A0A0V0QSY8_PSEPJ|nr:hypothetical protein PPERSA_00620 [Pseudocohnilembus persalinus]|eukprot:KRX05319.1 hypothetical protein PPERSA_00620 [Pseudocohnilembus persalinus]